MRKWNEIKHSGRDPARAAAVARRVEAEIKAMGKLVRCNGPYNGPRDPGPCGWEGSAENKTCPVCRAGHLAEVDPEDRSPKA